MCLCDNEFVCLSSSVQMVWVFLMNRMGSQGSTVAQRRRMALGVVILLLVDIIWVVSSELTSYIFKRQEYNKPFFSTFTKTSMFVLYLLGFLLWRPWRQQCTGSLRGRHAAFFADAEAYFTPCINDTSLNDHTLSEPLYVPVKFQDLPTEQTNCAIGDCDSTSKKQRVRFSNIMEVRQLPSTQALEAKLSRMSYPAAKDHESMLRTVGKLTVTDVAKISFFFCFVWFLANLSYQEALSDTQVAIVNILSSTSGLFTLILAAIFPSNSSDRFTLSKLLAVALSMGGVVLVSFSSMDSPDGKGTIGSLWSLAGAALYAVYIVMIKRKVDREDKLDIPMFFGFVGLFNLLLLWPGFLVLHYTGFEAFELPSKLVWIYILINGLIGTVLSEFLWLWGCFLTSSLIGTLALSLTIPLSIIADICMQKVRFSWLFFAGAVPVFLSFFIATLLCHYNNWDPVMVALRRVFAFICRSKHRIQRLPEDCEQCESLIPLHTVSHDNESFCL
ncbi:solute carrier family 35 member F5 isoform X1 [Oncorhynchus tshawytscha]|uniref:Solute carrier family 35 member F5 n=3 Tax=Oncorhynchus TaxID=8016 RepID=A0A8C8BVB1_ONCTS|nr:solute carrier family 35 member F5 isoform X1 [Oncorhynchus tshawytscha]XP_024244515.1 solute carrier family 35 member F5 isoform X1 [Oncorhynchus tshawytscha]XP_024244516.1 solute carrier family 35 member F5 isoform X1 [Oncorhynchus tshawytscha]XP_024244517.1 solute carrier family 35 member F5 isoform X1 [Oncorhynchus tshawytscha]XP_024244518.1 solute carrier family 35 member F5 isoform X1 [Oncorhynchus tshawytscha]XP_042162329.1 solute carrier family 35 member F5 isoform X1 [Oncorhynchus 